MQKIKVIELFAGVGTKQQLLCKARNGTD